MTNNHNALVERGVRRALAYVAGVAEADISPSTCLDGLRIESVGVAAFRLVLEAELGIRISAEDLASMVLAENVAGIFAIARQLLAHSESSTSHISSVEPMGSILVGSELP